MMIAIENVLAKMNKICNLYFFDKTNMVSDLNWLLFIDKNHRYVLEITSVGIPVISFYIVNPKNDKYVELITMPYEEMISMSDTELQTEVVKTITLFNECLEKT